MYRSAGLVARTEVKDMLPDNGDIPGDIVVEGMPNTGNGLVIDVTVTDSRTITEGDSLVSLQRRASTVGVEAREKEESKRNKKGGVGNERMQDRVRAIGYNFCPIAFEVDGAVGDTWSINLKQLSEIAHERRGSNRASFRTSGPPASVYALPRRVRSMPSDTPTDSCRDTKAATPLSRTETLTLCLSLACMM